METKNKRGKLIPVLIVLALALLCLWCWRSGLFDTIRSVEDIRALLARSGPWAGIVYFILQMMTVIIAPIPSNISMMAGALALGFWPAMLLGVGAVVLGSVIVFLAARRLGQEAVQRWIDRGTMERYLPIIEEKQEMFLFLTMLFPFFPDDAICILAGLTKIPFLHFLIIMIVTRPWGLVFAALVGSGAFAVPLWGWVVLGGGMFAIFVLAMKYSAAIESWLLERIQNITGRKTP